MKWTYILFFSIVLLLSFQPVESRNGDDVSQTPAAEPVPQVLTWHSCGSCRGEGWGDLGTGQAPAAIKWSVPGTSPTCLTGGKQHGEWQLPVVGRHHRRQGPLPNVGGSTLFPPISYRLL
ncbi:unnamed protein product, partial [Iphiclides podalirius]